MKMAVKSTTELSLLANEDKPIVQLILSDGSFR